jgi:hypothetical protein
MIRQRARPRDSPAFRRRGQAPSGAAWPTQFGASTREQNSSPRRGATALNQRRSLSLPASASPSRGARLSRRKVQAPTSREMTGATPSVKPLLDPTRPVQAVMPTHCCLSESGPRSSRGRVVVGWCVSGRSAGARAYLGARPDGRRRDGRWVDPRGTTPAARSLVDRRPWAGVATAAGAGRKSARHLRVAGWAERVGGGQVTGSKAAGPSSRSVWKQRRASLRAIVSDALVCESPRALSAR